MVRAIVFLSMLKSEALWFMFHRSDCAVAGLGRQERRWCHNRQGVAKSRGSSAGMSIVMSSERR